MLVPIVLAISTSEKSTPNSFLSPTLSTQEAEAAGEYEGWRRNKNKWTGDESQANRLVYPSDLRGWWKAWSTFSWWLQHFASANQITQLKVLYSGTREKYISRTSALDRHRHILDRHYVRFGVNTCHVLQLDLSVSATLNVLLKTRFVCVMY